MKIISIRQGLTADHSSTSYEFAAIDKALGREARASVSSLSSRANPTKRTVSFVYNAEGYDIPGGWVSLMRDHYDVMHRNEYDWWTLAVAFNATEEQREEVAKYEFCGVEDLGVGISVCDDRVIVAINCQLEYGEMVDYDRDYYEEEIEEEEGPDEGYEPDDALLNLLASIRRQLMDGDYRALYAVWEKYGLEDEGSEENEELEEPPAPPEKTTGAHVISELKNLLSVP